MRDNCATSSFDYCLRSMSMISVGYREIIDQQSFEDRADMYEKSYCETNERIYRRINDRLDTNDDSHVAKQDEYRCVNFQLIVRMYLVEQRTINDCHANGNKSNKARLSITYD
jgi:hypothetical protein